jgi:cyclic pyranopterin phosphate synthase
LFQVVEIKRTHRSPFPLVALDGAGKPRGAETAARYRFADGAPGEIGIIAPVTESFCGACSRIRLTADGQIRTCLFSKVEHSLRDVMRDGASANEIIAFIRETVFSKEAGHNIGSPAFIQPQRTMSLIGG